MPVVVPGGTANSVPTLGFSSEPQIVGFVNGSVTLRCFFYGKLVITFTTEHANKIEATHKILLNTARLYGIYMYNMIIFGSHKQSRCIR